MQQIIKDGVIQSDDWILVSAPDESQTEGRSDYLQTDNRYILPVEDWLQLVYEISDSIELPGLWLNGNADLESLRTDIHKAPVVAVEFSAFTDGSGFSTASLLREEFGFSGELRAFGAILPDQVPYLIRCGFNSVMLSQSQDLELAVAQLEIARHSYQGSVDRPRTPFQQRVLKQQAKQS